MCAYVCVCVCMSVCVCVCKFAISKKNAVDVLVLQSLPWR